MTHVRTEEGKWLLRSNIRVASVEGRRILDSEEYSGYVGCVAYWEDSLIRTEEVTLVHRTRQEAQAALDKWMKNWGFVQEALGSYLGRITATEIIKPDEHGIYPCPPITDKPPTSYF